PLRELSVEVDHDRLVLGTNRSDRDHLAVLQLPLADVLFWIRPDRALRQVFFLCAKVVQNDSSIEGKQPVRRGEQRIDVEFLDPRILDDQFAEPHQELFHRGEIHRLASTYTLQSFVDLRLLHHATGERGVQRRESQSLILEDFHQLSAGAEQQYGAKLRVDARTEDDLVAV